MFSLPPDYFFKSSLTDLAFWYPILKSLWVPTPETYIIKNDIMLFPLMDGIKPDGLDHLIDNIDYYAQKVWYPCFLRTGHTSNKHDWENSCFLQSKDEIAGHLTSLQELSVMADMRCPWSMDTIVVRKLIETKPAFYCFNNMPITKEVRIFIKDWAIESIHPYWPLEAFHWRIDNLEENLAKLNVFTDSDREFFTAIWTFLSKSFSGYWSVDFLQDKSWKWVCIDMAVGDSSYKNEVQI